MNAVNEFLDKHKIKTVEMSLVDLTGALRGKRLPVQAFKSHGLGGEVGLSSALFAWDYQAEVFTNDRYNWSNGYPDVFLRPDLDTLRVVAWRPGTAFVTCDVMDQAGRPVEVSPRQILRQVIEELRVAGYEANVGLETEFYVLDAASGAPRTSRIPCYSLHDDSYMEPMLADVRQSLETAGIEVEASGAEYGPGQVEINLRYRDPLGAADELTFFRYAVKQIAARYQLMATFMPKPFGESSGSGLHVHQSLNDADGINVFWDAAAAGLSETAHSYAAGLLRYLAQIQAVAVPTPNGYKRISQHSFAPTTMTWGSDNRATAVRALVRGQRGTRLEARSAASDANPYLLTALLLMAGLSGAREKLPLQPEATTDSYSEAGYGLLPADPSHAARLLAGSEFAISVLGELAVQALVTVLEREAAVARSQVADWERARYLDAV